MAYTKYFEAINDTGHVYINDDYKNMSLVEAFSCTAVDTTGKNDEPDRTWRIVQWQDSRGNKVNACEATIDIKDSNIKSDMLSFWTDNPDLLIRADRGIDYYRNDDVWGVSVVAPNYTVAQLAEAVKNIHFNLYRYDNTNVKNKIGLQVFNGKSECLFDSNKKYLTILNANIDYKPNVSEYLLNKSFPPSNLAPMYSFSAKSKLECVFIDDITLVSDKVNWYNLFVRFPTPYSIELMTVVTSFCLPWWTVKEFVNTSGYTLFALQRW